MLTERYRSTLRLVTRTHQESALSEKKDWKLDLSKAHRKLVWDFVPSYCSFYLSDVNDYVQWDCTLGWVDFLTFFYILHKCKYPWEVFILL